MSAQVILFGSPGVGKSFLVDNTLLPELGIDPNGEDCMKTVFHPEYTYGDFMGKLLPITKDDGRVQYNFYEGHLLRALARAYKRILENPDKPSNVALVIDEINRGNSAAIFGGIFQLLDRAADGWSSYHVNVSDMEFDKLIELINIETNIVRGRNEHTYRFNGKSHSDLNQLIAPLRIRSGQIRIPSNLSIFATMNTSDTSIYYMDSAFKRRWDWEFIDVDSSRATSNDIAFTNRDEWQVFVRKLNAFIRRNSSHVRNLEDKQVGYWFIKDASVTKGQIQNKLMFFLWDSVFPRDKKPLANLLGLRSDELATFGDFTRRVDDFVKRIAAVEE